MVFARPSSHTRRGRSNSDWSSCENSTGGEYCFTLPNQHESLTIASLKDNANAIETACKLDLGKGVFEANLAELNFCTTTIIYDINNLRKWAKDESSPDVPLDLKVLRPKIRKDPLGNVLIIGYVAPNISMSRR